MAKAMYETVSVAGCAGKIGQLPHGLAESCDLVRPEACPVVAADFDNRNLRISKGQDMRKCIIVLAQIDDLIINAALFKRTISGIALDTGRLAVNGDGHVVLHPEEINQMMTADTEARRGNYPIFSPPRTRRPWTFFHSRQVSWLTGQCRVHPPSRFPSGTVDAGSLFTVAGAAPGLVSLRTGFPLR
ncbi:conserved hypothetical protein [Roseibium sp. TrichSKD4]|nr:conserved hypothetical protein [Roseibium sp. TrichSKD4]